MLFSHRRCLRSTISQILTVNCIISPITGHFRTPLGSPIVCERDVREARHRRSLEREGCQGYVQCPCQATVQMRENRAAALGLSSGSSPPGRWGVFGGPTEFAQTSPRGSAAEATEGRDSKELRQKERRGAIPHVPQTSWPAPSDVPPDMQPLCMLGAWSQRPAAPVPR